LGPVGDFHCPGKSEGVRRRNDTGGRRQGTAALLRGRVGTCGRRPLARARLCGRATATAGIGCSLQEPLPLFGRGGPRARDQLPEAVAKGTCGRDAIRSRLFELKTSNCWVDAGKQLLAPSPPVSVSATLPFAAGF
jgi:hypothetical protein